MKTRLMIYSVSAATIAAMLCSLLISLPYAQNKAPVAKSETVQTPRMADGHPNFSGFYDRDRSAGERTAENQQSTGSHVTARLPDGSFLYEHVGEGAEAAIFDYGADPNPPPPYKPEYLAQAKKLAAAAYGRVNRLDPITSCIPLGVPRAWDGAASTILHIVQNPEYMAILYEDAPGPQFRLIYTDGRKHPADFDPSPMGHSIGHWEGDSLVVDTVGLNDETWLSFGTTQFNHDANIHSDQEHVIERYSRNGSTLTMQATVEDPIMFTHPWVLPPKSVQLARPGNYLQTYRCDETNDRNHIISPTETDKFLCNYCVTDKVYGGSGDKTSTGAEIPDALKDAAKGK